MRACVFGEVRVQFFHPVIGEGMTFVCQSEIVCQVLEFHLMFCYIYKVTTSGIPQVSAYVRGEESGSTMPLSYRSLFVLLLTGPRL